MNLTQLQMEKKHIMSTKLAQSAFIEMFGDVAVTKEHLTALQSMQKETEGELVYLHGQKADASDTELLSRLEGDIDRQQEIKEKLGTLLKYANQTMALQEGKADLREDVISEESPESKKVGEHSVENTESLPKEEVSNAKDNKEIESTVISGKPLKETEVHSEVVSGFTVSGSSINEKSANNDTNDSGAKQNEDSKENIISFSDYPQHVQDYATQYVEKLIENRVAVPETLKVDVVSYSKLDVEAPIVLDVEADGVRFRDDGESINFPADQDADILHQAQKAIQLAKMHEWSTLYFKGDERVLQAINQIVIQQHMDLQIVNESAPPSEKEQSVDNDNKKQSSTEKTEDFVNKSSMVDKDLNIDLSL